jgi:hypothetical protein
MSDERCSCEVSHAPHTFGGRPMQYCPGIPFTPATKDELDAGIIRDPVNGWAIRND